jgi:tetratricopeptide (TPR) repeat protein
MNKQVFLSYSYRMIKHACGTMPRCILPVLIHCLLAISTEQVCRAEESTTIIVGDLETLPPVVTPELIPRPDTVDLDCPVPSFTRTDPVDQMREGLIKELSNQRAALGQKWHAIIRTDSIRIGSQRNKPPIIANIDRKLVRAERHYADLHGRLDDQMSRLESVLRSRQNDSTEMEAHASPSEPIPSPASKSAPFLQATIEHSSPNPTSSIEDAGESSEPSLAPITVTNEPVDQFALANNLYAVGQWQLALQIYEKLSLADAAESEQAWIQSQIAACYRKLGKHTEAEKLYRTVAGRAEDDYMGENARWWLDTVQHRKELQSRLDQLETTLEALQMDSR